MRIGTHLPTHPGASGNLFVYGEAPVSSAKLNCWQGNISGGFWLVQTALRQLVGQVETRLLLPVSEAPPLQVQPDSPPGLCIRIQPGILLTPQGLVGLSEVEAYPSGTAFIPPVNHPRMDLLGITGTGSWFHQIGVEAATPLPPEEPENGFTLAKLYLRPGMTSILAADDGIQGYLIDQRPDVFEGSIHAHPSIFQPACASQVLTATSGPDCFYSPSWEALYPRVADTQVALSVPCPLQATGHVLERVHLYFYLEASTHEVNSCLTCTRYDSSPTSTVWVDWEEPEQTCSGMEPLFGDYYRWTLTSSALPVEIPAHAKVWLTVRMNADGITTSCRFLGSEWVFSEKP